VAPVAKALWLGLGMWSGDRQVLICQTCSEAQSDDSRADSWWPVSRHLASIPEYHESVKSVQTAFSHRRQWLVSILAGMHSTETVYSMVASGSGTGHAIRM